MFIWFIIVFVIYYWHWPQKLHHSKGQPGMFKLTDSLEEDQNPIQLNEFQKEFPSMETFRHPTE